MAGRTCEAMDPGFVSYDGGSVTYVLQIVTNVVARHAMASHLERGRENVEQFHQSDKEWRLRV